MKEESSELALEMGNLVELVWDKLLDWVETFVEMLPNMAAALLIVIFAGIASRLVSRLVARGASQVAANQQIVSLLSSVARVSVLCVGLFIALGVLQLEKTVTSLLAGIGVVGLALGFAFQDIAANFMSGVIMALREPFRVGDLVETHDIMGYVERVTLRATVIRNFWGQLVVIPNKDVLQNAITNYTQTGKRRIEVEVGVSYADDLEHCAQVARQALEGLADRDDSEPVDVFWTGFGGSSIDMSARFWIDLSNEKTHFLRARSEAISAIKRAFDEAEISIPFPIRTLDFGISGGENLAAMLSDRGSHSNLGSQNGSGARDQSSSPDSAR